MRVQLQRLQAFLWNNRTILTTVLMLGVFWGIMQWRNTIHREKVEALTMEALFLKQIIQGQDSIINVQGKTVYTQEAIIAESKKSLIEITNNQFKLKKENEKLIKEVLAYHNTTSRVTVKDPIVIPYTDTVRVPEYIRDTNRYYAENTITVPRTATIDSPYFSMSVIIDRQGLLINSLDLPDTISGRFVTESQGFFKRDIIKYQTVNTNPYITLKVQNSAIYVPKEKKLLRKIGEGALAVGIGIVVGLMIK